MDQYTIPKSIFYHLTASNLVDIVSKQRRHIDNVENVQSRIAELHQMQLSKPAIRVRADRRKDLKQKLNNNIGMPFSITSDLSGAQQLSMLYNIFQHHSRLREIARSDQNHLCSDNDEKEKTLKFVKRVRRQKEDAYKYARARFLGVPWHTTDRQLHPKPPSTRRHSGSSSARKKRSMKQIQKSEEQSELEKLIVEEMYQLMERKELENMDLDRRFQIVSRHTSGSGSGSRTQHKTRDIQSARTHHTKSKAPQRQIQSARKHRKKGSKYKKPSLLDEILQFSGTKIGEEKFGSTLPEFSRNVLAFMRANNLDEIKSRLNKRFVTPRVTISRADKARRSRLRSSMSKFRRTSRSSVRRSVRASSMMALAMQAKAPELRTAKSLKRGSHYHKRISQLSQITDLKMAKLKEVFEQCNGDMDLLENVIKSTETQKLEDSEEMEQVVKMAKLKQRPPWNGNTKMKKRKRRISTLREDTDDNKLAGTAWLRRMAYANVMEKKDQMHGPQNSRKVLESRRARASSTMIEREVPREKVRTKKKTGPKRPEKRYGQRLAVNPERDLRVTNESATSSSVDAFGTCQDSNMNSICGTAEMEMESTSERPTTSSTSTNIEYAPTKRKSKTPEVPPLKLKGLSGDLFLKL